jgi:glucose/mannose-6-phosphate isomerase
MCWRCRECWQPFLFPFFSFFWFTIIFPIIVPMSKKLSTSDRNSLRRFDKSDMFEVLAAFPQQIRRAVEIGTHAPYFQDKSPFRSLIFAGMGGSAIGGDLLRCCLQGYSVDTFSVAVSRGYGLPAGVSADTAVILSSYSGGTEETLATFDAARKKTKRLMCISTGGELAARAKKGNIPSVTTPAGMQPRCAVAYSLFPVLAALMTHDALGKKATTDLSKHIKETITLLEAKQKIYSHPSARVNPVFALAEQLCGVIPVVYSSPEMEAVNMRWRGQIQENAKTMAFGNIVPEMNHNEINGWMLPSGTAAPKNLFSVVMLRHDYEHARVKKRFDAMKPILKQRAKQTLEVNAEGASFLAQMMHLLYFGDWMSYWLALLNGQDPTTINDITALKKALS